MITGKHQTRLCTGTQRNKTQHFEESSQSSIPKGKKKKITDPYSLCYFLSQIKCPTRILCADTQKDFTDEMILNPAELPYRIFYFCTDLHYILPLRELQQSSFCNISYLSDLICLEQI